MRKTKKHQLKKFFEEETRFIKEDTKTEITDRNKLLLEKIDSIAVATTDMVG